MLLHIPKRDTLLRIENQQLVCVSKSNTPRLESSYPFYQILGFSAHKFWDGHLSSGYSPLRHDRGIFERCFTAKEFVRQDSQAPQIDLFIVKVLLAAWFDHLGREIVQRATHGISSIIGGVDTPAKVGDFDLAVDAHQYVFWLDVPVHDVLLVKIFERCCHLSDVLRCLPFGKLGFLPKMLVQFSLAREFQYQKDPLAVVEVAIEPEDVRVSEVTVNLDLSPDLLFHLALLQFALVQDFECADKARRSLLGKIHPSKFAFPQRLANLEHSQMPLLRLRLFRYWGV